MKIAISAEGPTLDAEVDPRFGRCQYFTIVDPETMEFETVDNSSAMASGGAGISAAQMIVSKGVQAVLTGNCGPNAYQVLSAAGIQLITSVSGRVRDAIQSYKSGKLQVSSGPSTPAHSGTGVGRGMGRGMGRRRNIGIEMTPPVNESPQSPSSQEGLQSLKAQSQALAQQLAEIQRQIENLEKGDTI